MPRGVLRDMRAAYAKALPDWWGPVHGGDGIVIHDRVGMQVTYLLFTIEIIFEIYATCS